MLSPLLHPPPTYPPTPLQQGYEIGAFSGSSSAVTTFSSAKLPALAVKAGAGGGGRAQASCPNGITHTEGANKNSVTFTFNQPAAGAPATITFYAVVVVRG